MLDCDVFFIPMIIAFVDSSIGSTAEHIKSIVGEFWSDLLVGCEVHKWWIHHDEIIHFIILYLQAIPNINHSGTFNINAPGTPIILFVFLLKK